MELWTILSLIWLTCLKCWNFCCIRTISCCSNISSLCYAYIYCSICIYTTFHFLITIPLWCWTSNIFTSSSWTCCSAICTFTNFCMIILRIYSTICCCTIRSYSICTSSLWSILTSWSTSCKFTIISSIIWNTGTEDSFFRIWICCCPFRCVSSTYWSTCSLWIAFWTIIITSC